MEAPRTWTQVCGGDAGCSTAPRMGWLSVVRVLALGVAVATAWAALPPDALKGLRSARFEERAAALETLGQSADPAAVPVVTPLLKDPDATVRWAAVEALDRLADPRALADLQDATQDPAPLVARRAQQAVAALRPRAGGSATGVKVWVVAPTGDVVETRSLEPLMQKNASAGFSEKAGNGLTLSTSSTEAAYVLTVSVRSVKTTQQGAQSVLEVVCSAVLTQMPGNDLRFATRVGAALAVDGALSDKDRQALLEEAVTAATTALGQETADHLSAKAP